MDFNTKPYMLRGKAHSVSTLHTALRKLARMPASSLSFDKEAAVLRDRDTGQEARFPRRIEGGLSYIDA